MPEPQQQPAQKPFNLNEFVFSYESNYGKMPGTQGVVDALSSLQDPAVQKLLQEPELGDIVTDEINAYSLSKVKQEALAEQDVMGGLRRGAVSGSLTAASMHPWLRIPKSAGGILKLLGASYATAAGAQKAPPVVSPDNILSLLGVGGNAVAATRGLTKFPGIVNAAEAGLGSAISQKMEKGQVDVSSMAIPTLASGGIGSLFGSMAKESPKTYGRKMEQAQKVLGPEPDGQDLHLPRVNVTLLPDKARKLNTNLWDDIYSAANDPTKAARKREALWEYDDAVKALDDVVLENKNASRVAAAKTTKTNMQTEFINDLYDRTERRVRDTDTNLKDLSDTISGLVKTDPIYQKVTARLLGPKAPGAVSDMMDGVMRLAKAKNASNKQVTARFWGSGVGTMATAYVGNIIYFLSPSHWAEVIQKGDTAKIKAFSVAAKEYAEATLPQKGRNAFANAMNDAADKPAMNPVSFLTRAAAREANEPEETVNEEKATRNLMSVLDSLGFPKTEVPKYGTGKETVRQLEASQMLLR